MQYQQGTMNIHFLSQNVLEKLREYLQSPEGKKQMVKLKGYEMTERFVRGGNHIDDDEDENADGGSWWCNIM